MDVRDRLRASAENAEEEFGSIVCEGPASVDQARARAERIDEERRRSQRRVIRTPPVLAAHALLRLALGSRMSDPSRQPQLLMIQVPSADWMAPVIQAWMHHYRGGRSSVRASSLPGEEVGTGDWLCVRQVIESRTNTMVAEAVAGLNAGLHVLAVVHDIAAVPAEFRAGADRHVVLPEMDWSVLRHVSEAVHGAEKRWSIEPRPDHVVLEKIGPEVLQLAMRKDQTAREYAAKCVAIAGNMAKVRDKPALKGFARVPAMGAVLDWGRTLAADLAAYKRGEIGWADVDRGAVICGPPGTGKTSFAAALAEECKVPLVATSYASWQAKGHQGELLRAMQRTFAEARKLAPCLLFIDEIDSFPNRQKLSADHGDYLRPVVNGLLAEIDGALGREGVVVLGACNSSDGLDPALLRAGRLERTINVGLPDADGLADILRVHLAEELPGADLAQIARVGRGMSGADVERAVREARRTARAAGRRLFVGDLLLAVTEHAGFELMAAGNPPMN